MVVIVLLGSVCVSLPVDTSGAAVPKITEPDGDAARTDLEIEDPTAPEGLNGGQSRNCGRRKVA